MVFKHKYITDSITGPYTSINGRKYLYFAGTGYFQLNAHPEMLKAASDAIFKYGIGSATSRALNGTTPLLVELEKKASEFFGTDDAAYLPSGYLSNIAGLNALNELGKYDVIYIDEGSHYCLVEGARISGKPVIKFKNRNVQDLKDKLEENLKNSQKPLIASDGLFPIWAKPAPLAEYLDLAEKHNGVVWIDDAHGVGILGKNGRGSYEHQGLESDRLFMGATFSKAFGAYGGIIPGSNEFIGKVKTGSVMTGSSAPVNATIAASIKGIELVSQNPDMRENLWDNALYLKSGMRSLGIKTDDNCLPVVAFSRGDENNMKRIHKELMDEGIYIQHAKYKGSGSDGVLRTVVFSTHTREMIDVLINKLSNIL